MTVITAAILVLSGVSFQDETTLEALLERLGGDDIDRVCEAEEELLRRGTEALPAIRKAIASGVHGNRDRLVDVEARIVRGLEASQLIGRPHRVRLPEGDRPIRQVVVELSRQSGWAVEVSGEMAGKMTGIQASDTTLWNVLEDLRKETKGLDCRFSGGRVVLESGAARQAFRTWDDRGLFQIDGVIREVHPSWSRFDFACVWAGNPGSRVRTVTVEILRAVDDQGRNLLREKDGPDAVRDLAMAETADSRIPLYSGTVSIPADPDFNLTQLAVVEGRVTLGSPLPDECLAAIPKPAPLRGSEGSLGKRAVRVEGTAVRGGVLGLHLSASFSGDDALLSEETVFTKTYVELTTRDGRRLTASPGMEWLVNNGEGAPMKARFSVSFPGVGEDEADSVRWMLHRGGIAAEIPFSFRHLSLD